MRSFLVLPLFVLACTGSEPAAPDAAQAADSANQVSPLQLDPVGPAPAPGTAYADVQVGDCVATPQGRECAAEVAGDIVRSGGVRLTVGTSLRLRVASDAPRADRVATGRVVRVHLAAPAQMVGGAEPAWTLLSVLDASR